MEGSLTCSSCGKDRFVKDTHRAGKMCRNCSNKVNGINKRGKGSWNSNMKFESKKIGSTLIDNDGYVIVYCGSFGGRKDGYQLLHRMLYGLHIGRKLRPNEIVHHIDGNGLNNSIENLYVLENYSQHKRIHDQLEKVSFELIQLGIIQWNGYKYIIAPNLSNLVGAVCELRRSLNDNSHGNSDPSVSIRYEGATTIQKWSRLPE